MSRSVHALPYCDWHEWCIHHCSVGVEITPHKRDHAYRVVDDLSFPLFHPSWGVRAYPALLRVTLTMTVTVKSSAQPMSMGQPDWVLPFVEAISAINYQQTDMLRVHTVAVLSDLSLHSKGSRSISFGSDSIARPESLFPVQHMPPMDPEP